MATKTQATREDVASYLESLPADCSVRSLFGIQFKKVHDREYKMRPDSDYTVDRCGHNGAAEYLVANRYAEWNR
jgi:hypothetical protein